MPGTQKQQAIRFDARNWSRRRQAKPVRTASKDGSVAAAIPKSPALFPRPTAWRRVSWIRKKRESARSLVGPSGGLSVNREGPCMREWTARVVLLSLQLAGRPTGARGYHAGI